MSHISDAARKFRRALRNKTGVHFSLEELRALASLGALDLVAFAENRELCPPRAEAANTDPTSGADAIAVPPPASGKSQVIPKDLGMEFLKAMNFGG